MGAAPLRERHNQLQLLQCFQHPQQRPKTSVSAVHKEAQVKAGVLLNCGGGQLASSWTRGWLRALMVAQCEQCRGKRGLVLPFPLSLLCQKQDLNKATKY